MRKPTPLLLVFLVAPCIAFAQNRAALDFQITKITNNLISAPQFAYGGAGRYQIDSNKRWLEVEVEFTATPDFTDELGIKYYVLFNGKLLTGEVIHSSILSGRSKRSVMYIPPNALAYLADNRPIVTNRRIPIAVSR